MPIKARFASLREIDRRFGGILRNIDPKAKDKSFQAYQEVGQILAGRSPRSFRYTSIMNEETNKLVGRVVPNHIGKMVCFTYDAKWKYKLPYWDWQPMVIPLGPKKGGFLGMNLHYLQPMARAVLFDFLLNNKERYGWMTENYQENMKYAAFKKRKIQMSYEDLGSICATPLYKPCIKHYLYSQLQTQFYLVDACDWHKFLFLPTEDFKSATKIGGRSSTTAYDKQKVWADSMAGGHGKRTRST